MGKTPKPLKILTSLDWPEFAALKEQGHFIEDLGLMDYDLILAPNSWLMDEDHRPYIKLAIAEARRRRYPKEPSE